MRENILYNDHFDPNTLLLPALSGFDDRGHFQKETSWALLKSSFGDGSRLDTVTSLWGVQPTTIPQCHMNQLMRLPWNGPGRILTS
jgi:hypothetical protein